MTKCGFCRGTEAEVGELTHLERVSICGQCAQAFAHQLGHEEGACANCQRVMPDAGRLHGEGDLKICESCLLTSSEGGEPAPLTHLASDGSVQMVAVGDKQVTDRRAVAEAVVSLSGALADRFFSGDLPKGDALATVRLAGIMAAKRTPELIPLAHPIALTSVAVLVERHHAGVRIQAECAVRDQTGVEMEALTAVSVAALTLYDMVKSIERGVVIGPIRLVSKAGGRSGEWAVSLADE